MADAIALVVFVILGILGGLSYHLIQRRLTRPASGVSYWSEHRQNQLVFEPLVHDHDTAIDQLIQNVNVNSKTLEVFLSLGGLLRSKGELSRAIKIHLHLLEQPALTKQELCDIQFELASDYIESGLLDRAESILLPLLNNKQQNESLAQKVREKLLLVYQDTQEWQKAISVIESFNRSNCSDLQTSKWNMLKAQFCCELAEQSRAQGDGGMIEEWLSAALSADVSCVRARLIQAQQKIFEKKFPAAIALLNKVPEQNSRFISEILLPLSQCYDEMNDMDELIDALRSYLADYCDPRALARFSEVTYQHYDRERWLSSLSEALEMFKGLGGIPETVAGILAACKKKKKYRFGSALSFGYPEASDGRICSI